VLNTKKGKKNNVTHSANRRDEMVPNRLCYIEQACAVIEIFATKFIKHRVLEFIQYWKLIWYFTRIGDKFPFM